MRNSVGSTKLMWHTTRGLLGAACTSYVLNIAREHWHAELQIKQKTQDSLFQIGAAQTNHTIKFSV